MQAKAQYASGRGPCLALATSSGLRPLRSPSHLFTSGPRQRHAKSRNQCHVLALNSGNGGGLDDITRILSKYGGGSGSGSSLGSPSSSKPMSAAREAGMGNGVFSLLCINFALHLASYFYKPAWMAALPLSHWAPHWWQFVTAAFVHANWEHLLSNAFSLLVFGRMVEEEEGTFGVWATYLLCGIGGNVASYLSSPHTRAISLGASSAVFGLFVVGVLTKLKPSAKRLMEAVVLGSFVARQVLEEVAMVSSGKALVAAGGQLTVGHMAHLGGAAAGVLLVLLLSRLPKDG